jgi:cyclopropane-fatty-acyl-phospholipid synthase
MDLGGGPGPKVTVQFHDQSLLFKLAQDFTLHLGEAYMDGRVTIKEGTLYDLLELFAINWDDGPTMPWEVVDEFFSPLTRLIQRNTPEVSRKNVAHHYDLSPNLFKLFLDTDLQYSCAYFTDPGNDLHSAQFDKKRLIAAKLLLKKGMRVLDIGCGFGGLALYLAKTYGVEVTGITLSEEQYKVAVERAKQEGLTELAKFHLRDYRKETERYDRVVSIAMFEAVGVRHFKEFFAQVKALLKDDGVALVHSIGRKDGPGPSDNWIRKYIFPGGYAPSLSEVLPILEKAELWVTDIEVLRLHYVNTLRCWRTNFEHNRQAIRQLYDERFCRMWEFYLVFCEMLFKHLSLMVFQIQLAKNINAVPITRDYIFKEMSRLGSVQIPESSTVFGGTSEPVNSFASQTTAANAVPAK